MGTEVSQLQTEVVSAGKTTRSPGFAIYEIRLTGNMSSVDDAYIIKMRKVSHFDFDFGGGGGR